MDYSDLLKDHLANPRHAGLLSDADAEAAEENPACGDRLRLTLRLVGETIVAVGFLAYGCPPTLACGSALAEMLHGQTISYATSLTRQDLINAVGGLPARKRHAAALALETLHAALSRAKLLT